MCGRLVVTSSTKQLLAAGGASRADDERPPRYNLAPTQDAPAVLNRDRAVLRWIRWGLTPRWARDLAAGARLFNARAETAAEKPSFRDALQKRRCVVLADGFYEWAHGETPKQPWFIHRKDGAPLLLAGLWDDWREPNGGREWTTFTILTTEPNDLIRPLHDRMPVILEASALETWLAPHPRPPADWHALFRPCPAELLTRRPVNPRVNSTAFDEPACLAPYTPPPRAQLELF